MKTPRKFLTGGIGLGIIVTAIVSVLFYSFTEKQNQPSPDEINKAMKEAYSKFKDVKEGKNADYIPYLAKVDPNLYGISIVTVDGKIYEMGDTKFEFGIQSISKVFTLAMALEELGSTVIKDSIGVNATGLPFNSVTAIELEGKLPQNPFVNAGAMATVSILKPKNNQQEKWNKLDKYFDRFAGRDIKVIEDMYKSEAATNQHNEAIAVLLQSYNRLYDNPKVTLDVYTRQCSFGTTAKDLAVMAATLANNGMNPVTKDNIVDGKYVPEILSVMTTAGLYENTGAWMYTVGLPAKSGVGGGIITVVPGVMGIAVFSPPLDKAGNSVKAQKTIEYIAEKLGLNLFTARK
ncbi:MAG: glutaminase A [Cytophagaceae bacterium]